MTHTQESRPSDTRPPRRGVHAAGRSSLPLRTGSRRRARGFSAVEMVVATISLSIMSAGVVGVSVMARDSLNTNGTLQRTHAEGKRALERLQRHLRAGSFATMMSQPEGFQEPQALDDIVDLMAAGNAMALDNLQFQNFAPDPEAPNDLPTLSGQYGINLFPTVNDPANGIDDDGDGFADEQRLVLTQPDGQQVVLCEDVAAFSCVVDGRTLQFNLTVAARAPDGTLFNYPSSLSVEIRND